ncbi:conserved hypothetical protein [Theileria orientalis strain Shintoku]|uniref:Kinase n=1 Tax=Theileria orientalis strain Shintoku TaxID=869250 RepID=J4C3T8_THEOR|nr:conserved hypothetical protein [Theileria orientalis strain Shintoku]PVC50602.1 hypothetical protein MACL_00002121 [Theileria orientalis]BAM41016.1 conserved hypothetical protein [Theileria orientalis strain Shintoku]|eukprot:XP_009691317.1 conserved hypothetical protein [Theileria orientalis strain Shintoku]
MLDLMERASDDAFDDTVDAPVPLETLGIDQLKLSGTSLILRDFDKKYIYKVIKLHSATEALFYSIAYRIYPPNVDDLRVNNINPKTFKNVSYLVEQEMIPQFYGITTISRNGWFSHSHSSLDYSWYELGKNATKNENIYRAIKLENLLRDFKNPGIIDIKLGSHNFNYSMNYGEIDDHLKLKCIDTYREMKHKYRDSVSNKKPFDYQLDLNASELGLPESYKSLDANTLQSVFKSWRQRQVALETTEQELGFRISSIYFELPDKKYLITSAEAKQLSKSETVNILKDILNLNKDEKFSLKFVDFLNRLKSWILLQTSVSIVASSILIIFDQDDLQHYKIKWIDFTHINHNSMNVSHPIYH